MSTTEKNVRGLARARGYRLHKVRSPYIEKYLIVDGGPNFPVENDDLEFNLNEAEEWLRTQPTLERGR